MKKTCIVYKLFSQKNQINRFKVRLNYGFKLLSIETVFKTLIIRYLN